MTDLTDLDALALSRLIRQRQVSCREVMQATLQRLARLNPVHNAVVSLAAPEHLLEQAEARDDELARGQWRGWLHGIPQALKDASMAEGFPTTWGSTLLRDAVAPHDGLMAARMKAAGCIVIGKSNMPEFGLGSHTFNRLFGITRNAWDPAVSAGGSSGGAAVALALRLLPVADGSDYMGSLRNPAAWNHVFGLRPSQGRVPLWPAADAWVAQFTTEGPMARTVHDLAALLATQAGFDPRAPLSIAGPVPSFEIDDAAADPSSLRGLHIGWLGDLGGHLAMEDGLMPVLDAALRALAGAGAIVQPVSLGVDLHRLWDAWCRLRHALVAPRVATLLQQPGAREALKPELLWEHDQALTLRALDLMRASEVRTAYHARLLELFEQVDVLALPATQVWPFPVEQPWPRRIAGRTMDTYHRWMEVTLYASFGGLPALSVPAGFHANGRWPAGLQLVGRPHGDAALLRTAAAYETLQAALLARRPDAPAAPG